MARPRDYDITNIVGKGIVRDATSPHYGRHLLRDQKLKCNNCQALMFYEEKKSGNNENPSFSLCCNNKQFTIPPIPAIPALIQRLLDQNNFIGKHFVDKIRSYNSMFAFTSFKASVNKLYIKLFFNFGNLIIYKMN
jgi:hypothetical protein